MLDKTAPEKESKSMISPNNHTSTSTYDSKGKLLKIGENSGRISNGLLIKKRETGTTNYSNNHKKQSIIQKVMDNQKDTKGLFRLINQLTNNNKGNTLPKRPPEVLADEVVTYFLEKIRTIWEKFINTKPF